MNTMRRELIALMEAVRFFTRIPVPDRIPHSADSLNHSARYFPAIGLLVGAVSAIAFSIAALVVPTQVAVLIAMGSSIYLTGAFHEDGLSDMTDGLGGGWDKLRILEIMKDSRVGSYGVVVITMTLLGKFVLLDSFDPLWIPFLLMAAHAFSRYCSVLIMAGLSYVREDRLSKSKPLATKLTRKALWIASVFGLLPLLLLPAAAALVGVAAGLLTTIWLGRKLQTWLGGYTGDCLGATQQLTELAFYLGALAVLS